jgi:hypothetical protein
MPERSCTIYPPAGRDATEHDKALRDAALFMASELGLTMHTVASALTWRGDRIATGWRVIFRDDAGLLPESDDALADLVAERAEREWSYLYGHDDSNNDDAAGARFTVQEVLRDPELAALFAKLAGGR